MARLSPDKAKVLRDRIWNELIPGDIIKIKLGDIIRADVRLLKGGPVKIYKVWPSLIDAVVIATGSRTKFGEHTHPVDTTNQDDQYQKARTVTFVDFTAILQFCMCVAVVAMLIETVVMDTNSLAYNALRDNGNWLPSLVSAGFAAAGARYNERELMLQKKALDWKLYALACLDFKGLLLLLLERKPRYSKPKLYLLSDFGD
ncbi:hypothetical protein C5167_011974 [Papaver somniferum]|uniref:Cation-transporting P-type ATPase N-terminal domain-containing protein n=1 Tax=Papaver somniferum TaxID=3469 RepID=A0A4Y7IZA0_PAPSO|nr:hypothetical protein C5167_011974 [Papaver somniferum]